MSRPNTPKPGAVEFPEPVMLPPIYLDSRDRSHWERLDIGRPLDGLPPVAPRPDTAGWPVVNTAPAGEWLGSFDEHGNRVDVPPTDGAASD